jgi:hypothetical protein
MFSLIIPAFLFIAVIIIGALISLGLFFSRRQVIHPQERRDESNIIDVQALEDDQPSGNSSTDPQLKP